MLIKVDVYEGTSTTPSRPTLYSCVGTTIRRYYSDNDDHDGQCDHDGHDDNPNAGLLLSVGRKGNSNDIAFPSEKSVSKKHFQIRCISSSSSQFLKGCMKPRNEEESKAVDQHPNSNDNSNDSSNNSSSSVSNTNINTNNMCLVLDDPSKAGVFIAQPKRPKKKVVVDEDDDAGVKNDQNEDDGDGGSDSDTDVEDSAGGAVHDTKNPTTTSKQQQQQQQRRRRQSNSSSISGNTSTTAGTNPSSSTTTNNNLVYPTMATKEFVAKNYSHYYHEDGNGSEIEIDMIPVTLPLNEPGSIILPLGQYKGRDDDDDDDDGDDHEEGESSNRKLRVDSVSNRVIMIQVTDRVPITIRIEWIPINVVFSTVSEEIKNRLMPNLYKIGATVQSQVIASCNNGLVEGGRLLPTTHLVASQFSPVPKQLTAWALNLPFVSPEWLSDMITKTTTKISEDDGNGNLLTTVLPFHCGGPNDDGTTTPTNPKYVPVQGSKFASKKPSNKDLLSKYTLLVQNENDDNGDAERLGGAAGMNIVRLYELKTQKLKKQRIVELIHTSSSSSSSSKDKNGSIILTTSKLPSNLLPSSSSANNMIEIIRARDVAKAITDSQPSKLIEMIQKKNQSQLTNDTTTDGTKSRNTKTIDDDDEDMAIEIPSGQSQAPLLLERDFANTNSDKTEKKDGVDTTIGSKKNDLSTLHEDEEDEDQDIIKKEEKSSGENSKTVTRESEVSSSTAKTKRPALGRANAMGWYTVAPKDDKTRFEMRQKASKVYKDQNGLELEDPISSTDIIHVKDVPPLNSTTATAASTTLGRRGDTGHRGRNDVNGGVPDFRKFRKNYVVIPDIDDYVILNEDDATPNKAKDAVRQQMSEQQRLLEEEQRQADALFFGTAGGPGRGTGAKRRRRT